MIDKNILCNFLVEAKKSTYAAGGNATQIKEKDNSTTLIYESGNLKYHDNYFGGEPFGGREVVFQDGKPVYIMTYYGFVYENISDFKDVYKILQEALMLIPQDNPYRGPQKYINGNYEYLNNFDGDINYFHGEEIINLNGEIVYKTKYMGGSVDSR